MSKEGMGMVNRVQRGQLPSSPMCKIAVIGDIHDQWDEDDAIALKHLGVDLVLFVGDFGNEAVELVRAIANLDLPKAAIFGNHDAWYTATDWGRSKSPYDHRVEDRVQQQIDLLGEAYVGYSCLDFPAFNLSVVGGRPFSWGGSAWKNEKFYLKYFEMQSFADSTEQIVAAAEDAAFETILFMGHCGPTGLGSAAEDPCGKDWQPIGGDHGDPDLEMAIARTLQQGKTIPLVTFGHMHHQLRHTKTQIRKRIVVKENGTVYLNAASVPRIIRTEEGWRRNFSIVTLESGRVQDAALVWVDQDLEIVSEEVLYQSEAQLIL
ncbi:MAG: TIGR04168 family protein [Oculatellaceae cyanobacterium Prado106]|nr:TIGR04168 family protein [Oculatellaceae cyanobacterium Prado106]